MNSDILLKQCCRLSINRSSEFVSYRLGSLGFAIGIVPITIGLAAILYGVIWRTAKEFVPEISTDSEGINMLPELKEMEDT